MDLIDRQTAIDALTEAATWNSVMHRVAIDIIKKLPSAEPKIEEKLGFLEFLWNVINPNDMEQYWSMYHCSGEEKIDG